MPELSYYLSHPDTIICRLPGKLVRWGLFRHPERIVEATSIGEIGSALAEIEVAAEQGFYAAGFITYEASPAFDPALTTHAHTSMPLLRFGIYRRIALVLTARELVANTTRPDNLRLNLQTSYEDYAKAIERIHQHLADGDIYQTNFTIRADAANTLSPDILFPALFKNHPAPFAAYVNTGNQQFVSLSPELFLHREGKTVKSSPMKGTAARQLAPEEDMAMVNWLSNDPKNRAENLMIVDMVRNDLGRVCRPGSISVKPLFHVDTYATVHQMISTVHGELTPNTSFSDLLRATFPAASITGAPKIRAMSIIRELEDSPRGIYTGSIGCIAPGGDCLFNVAIRTLQYSRDGKCQLGIGGGIVADSSAAEEWKECECKSRFTTAIPHDFQILETMLYHPDTNIALLESHLARASRSQRYFRRTWREKVVRNTLDKLKMPDCPARVRMTVDAAGTASFIITPLASTGWGKPELRLVLAKETIASYDVFHHHKTTSRERYDRVCRQAVATGFDEAVFQNERGEITEGGISNIFVKRAGQWLTPPLHCGVLPGIWRQRTIAELNVRETILFPEDLLQAEDILIGNAVRGAGHAVLICKTIENGYSEPEAI